MHPSNREVAAAQRLAYSLVEFLAAWSEGNATRTKNTLREALIAHCGAARSGMKQAEVKPDPNRLIAVREAARYLSIGERKLWELSAPRGAIPVIRIGRSIRYRQADLDKAIESMRANRSEGGTT